jgi:drug/metabolite transporter (DMT)-like permease
VLAARTMTSLALLLLLVAAVLHATWNYWAKRAGGGLPFVYLVSIMIVAGYVPVVAVYCSLIPVSLPWTVLVVIFVSGCLKTSYSLYLQRGYRHGDFSLIYPLARGTGPLLSTVGAVLLLGERPSLLVIAGGCVVIGSIFNLTGGMNWLGRRLEGGASVKGLRYGIISGVFIAAYTLWDRQGVSYWLIPPLLYDAGTALTQLCLLTPFAWRRRAEVVREWREHRKHALIMTLAAPAAYVLVLTAMSFTPVSYVAPAREVSILIGAFFGAKFLKESDQKRRLWAAAAMVGGIIALALG